MNTGRVTPGRWPTVTPSAAKHQSRVQSGPSTDLKRDCLLKGNTLRLPGAPAPVGDAEPPPSWLDLFRGLRSYVRGGRNQWGLPESGLMIQPRCHADGICVAPSLLINRAIVFAVHLFLTCRCLFGSVIERYLLFCSALFFITGWFRIWIRVQPAETRLHAVPHLGHQRLLRHLYVLL